MLLENLIRKLDPTAVAITPMREEVKGSYDEDAIYEEEEEGDVDMDNEMV